jgi:alkylation response protein AidB-like acyl-CoA dehydrogenase
MHRWTEEEDSYRHTLRQFVARELAPHVDAWEQAELVPREIFRRMGELGFFGAAYPEAVGGAGGSWWYSAIYAEELAASGSAGLNMSLMVQSDMATPVIAAIGTPAQHAEFLTPAIRGEKIAALGVSEPGAGSDVAGITTTARRVGDEYVVDGAKTYITNGTQADFITLAVRTGGPGHKGLSLLLFPTDVAGFQVTRKLHKIGNHASDTAELAFTGCRVPARCLLGEEGQGFRYIMQNFQGERLIAAVGAVATAQRALDEAIAWARERAAFGRRLLDFQVWRHQLADLLTEVAAARALTYDAVERFVAGGDATLEVSQAKLYATELCMRVVDRCLQLFGGAGYMDDMAIARRWRDVRLWTIGGGTSEIMREIISKRAGLELPVK